MTTIERVDAVPEVRTARLLVDGRELDLPIEAAVDGQDAINISSLLKDAQLTTLDYGYANTAPTRSAITFLDGDAGILRYRGYPIEELAEQATFLETAWLLVRGELPTRRSSTPGPRRSGATRSCARSSATSSTPSRWTPTRWRSSARP